MIWLIIGSVVAYFVIGEMTRKSRLKHIDSLRRKSMSGSPITKAEQVLLKGSAIAETIPAMAYAQTKINQSKLRNDIDDTVFYDQVATELENNNRQEGLWLKALSLSDGDQSKAKARYARFRVEQLYVENTEYIQEERDKLQQISEETLTSKLEDEAHKNLDIVRRHDVTTFSFSHIAFWPSLLFPIWVSIYLFYKDEAKRGGTALLITLASILLISFLANFLFSTTVAVIVLAVFVGYIYYLIRVCENINRWISERINNIQEARDSTKYLDVVENNAMYEGGELESENYLDDVTTDSPNIRHVDITLDPMPHDSNTAVEINVSNSDGRRLLTGIGIFLFIVFALLSIGTALTAYDLFSSGELGGTMLSGLFALIFAYVAYWTISDS